MVSVRQKFVLRLHLIGLGIVVVLGVVVAVLLAARWRPTGRTRRSKAR